VTAALAPVAPPVEGTVLDGRRPLVIRTLAAVGSGVAIGLAFQPYGVWPLLFAGVAMLTLTVRGLPLRRAFGLGYLTGLALLGATISWIHVLGWWIAVLLIAVLALYFGVLGVALRLVGALRWWPVAAAACWVMIEFVYSRAPLGGFGWTRIAYAAVDTPLAGFFPVLGVAGVSFLAALLGQLIAWVAVDPRRRGVVGASTVAGLLIGGAVLRTYEPEPLNTGSAVGVGIVQGNVPGRGIEALGRMRSVTNNHLSETVALATRWRLGEVPRPDFILWPENSTDIDPFVDPVTRTVVESAAQVADMPILVGAVTRGPGPDERQTTALWWDPRTGVEATYHKRNLVPFGEWIPFRQQLLPLIPLLAQVGAQSVAGTAPGVLTAPLNGGVLRVGDVICFELAYDQTVYDTIRNGAQISVVQSNNATYGGTGQIDQQFAITRARAMETRREIAVATTNSVSGFIDRDGRVVHRTQEFTAASMVVSMPLRSAVTPAVLVAPWLDRGLAGAAALACIWLVLRHRRRSSETLDRDLVASGPAHGAPQAETP
jgi:apolipoprotein N-acyltransferase